MSFCLVHILFLVASLNAFSYKSGNWAVQLTRENTRDSLSFLDMSFIPGECPVELDSEDMKPFAVDTEETIWVESWERNGDKQGGHCGLKSQNSSLITICLSVVILWGSSMILAQSFWQPLNVHSALPAALDPKKKKKKIKVGVFCCFLFSWAIKLGLWKFNENCGYLWGKRLWEC